MASKPWHGSKWPKGVSHDVSGFEKPLYSILDEAASKYPDATYTIFADVGHTFR